LQGQQYANDVTNRYQYDSLNRLTNLVWGTSSSSLARFALVYAVSIISLMSGETIGAGEIIAVDFGGEADLPLAAGL
jgi:hypothetical protein